MSDDDLSSFGASFKGFMDKMSAAAPDEEPPVKKRLKEHFDADPTTFPIVSEKFAKHEHANLQRAFDAVLTAGGTTHELIGVSAPHEGYMQVGLAQLLTGGRGFMGGEGAGLGPVRYANIQTGDDATSACVHTGVFLISNGAARSAMYVRGPSEMGYREAMTVEVIAPNREQAEELLGNVRKQMRLLNVYRGQVVSLAVDEMRTITVKFHRLEEIARNDIILSSGVLERIERHTIGFAEHADQLRESGRHLKRGLLLYGPPGTGKTMTAMHLAGRMKDRTVMLLTGRGLGLIEDSVAMARVLQPATLILEDVDLIAEERQRAGQNSCNTVLYELLNAMDGLAEDADILFILTTNRPDILEPALAARPGRVDMAVEVPAPDAACRRRLIELYGRGLSLKVSSLDDVVEKTEGVSASFIRELLRKAALAAADSGDGINVKDEHLADAIRELMVDGGPITAALLGGRQARTMRT